MSSVMSIKPQSSNSDEVDLGRLFGELLDHRKLIVSVTAIFAVLAIIYAQFATPIYQADALIQVEQKQGNALINSISQILPDSQPESAPEIALLQSRMILGKTVQDLNLQAKVEQKYFPIFGRGWARMMGQPKGNLSVSRLYLQSTDGDVPKVILTVVDGHHFHIIGNGIDVRGSVGELIESKGISILINKMDALPGTSFTITYLTDLEAIDNLQKSFTAADQGKDTGILNLTLTGDDPILIKQILSSISENYLDQNIARQAAQDAKSLQFLNTQLPQVRNDLNTAEDKLNAYRKQSDSVDLSLEAKSALDQIVNVDNQLNELTFREAEISQLYTKSHPTYKALLEKRQTLEEEKGKLNQRVAKMPATQQEVLRLSRDVESGQAIYMQLLNRQQELSIAESSAIGNVRIIDTAVTQPKPVKPKKIIVVLIGIILGGMLSVGIVLLRVLLHRGIESPEQLEELGINVYASIPLSEWMVKKGKTKKYGSKKGKENIFFLAQENSADLAIEAIRGLRTSLHFAMMEAKNNVLMISSASPNAGKTFISSNMSALLATGNQRVLFIDADLRKGYAHKLFKGNLDHGLSDILVGNCTIEQGIKTVAEVGFDYISRGKIPPNPVELLMHERFGKLIEWASDNYDIVVIDTAPILAVTDAAVIGRYAGTSLLVARFEVNTAKEIAVSIKYFEQSGIKIKGCILNGMVRRSSSYYSYGYNHYGYTYADKKAD
ncbi:polysaccharide biosynthesis tyrosine autokinase [Pantoea cypripedii]|uniref:Tyrosine-protein kinase n=1 Tax=Pantoea cypripedii TaxID=55209 RepID=A0A6B9GA96_PANCY|nr:polysaccharide biosynthesis tyrosine autokinase [Pantoea cypripedii]QGY32290.1 tyrosine-protein kinase [Pantoea cypripedii]